MKKKVMKMVCAVVLGCSVLLGVFMEQTVVSRADEPYESYHYNYWGEAVLQPHSYLYERTLSQTDFGTKLSFPQDMCIYENKLYIADTGNSRILKMDLQGRVELEITGLKDPQGVFINDDGHIYVADSGNSRIAEFDANGEFIREILRPETNLISESQEFKPIKVLVDHAGRIYCIAYGINMGLMEFNQEGVFQGFMGAAEVSVSKFTYIWKNYFSTQAQQARMQTIVPTEYSNIFVDDENFVYATINNLTDEDHRNGADAIRRLNPTGTDVLRRLSHYDIIGDIATDNWSSFCDVAATDYGCYYVLDDAGGKVFAYDYDGNCLFVFGKKGIKEGNVQKPSAIALTENEDEILILDSNLGNIVVYDITEYGQHILDAIRFNDKGDSEAATREWNEVLKCNSNNELAYIGLGKSYLNAGDNKKAMEYFKLGNSRKYYTKAFYYYRKETMEANFGKAMLFIGIIIAVVIVIKQTIRFRRWVGEVRCFMSKQ